MSVETQERDAALRDKQAAQQQARQGSHGGDNWPSPDPGLKSNAPIPKPLHDNPDAVEHAQLSSGGNQGKKEGGKEMGLIDPPITSMHPTSQPQGDAAIVEPKFRIVDNANFKLNHYLDINGHQEFKYPFNELKPGQGLYIEVEQGSTTDKLMADLYKQVNQYVKQNSEVDRDENGDDIMTDTAINQKKRNDDGTVQMDGDKPRLGIKSGFVPKLIGPTFTVKAVVKDDELADGDKAENDGAFIVRMS